MKTLCRIAVVGLVLLGRVGSLPGAEPRGDGNLLLKRCTDALRVLDHSNQVMESAFASVHTGWCMGYIGGTLDMNQGYQIWSIQRGIKDPQLLFCEPLEVAITPDQGVRIIVRYLQSHPERLHFPAGDLVIQALREAFPCAPAVSRLKR